MSLETKASKQVRRARRKKTSSGLGKQMSFNEFKYKTSWTLPSVTSGTAGTMSSWSSPSIIHSSEYSVIGNLFNEIKLLSCKFIFGPVQAANGSVAHGTLVVGTNMLRNESTGANPAGYGDVQNLVNARRISTLSVKETFYTLPVPSLTFSNLNEDAPNPVTPWAGCPGIVQWYGADVTASTAWFTVHVEATYYLRGRQ